MTFLHPVVLHEYGALWPAAGPHPFLCAIPVYMYKRDRWRDTLTGVSQGIPSETRGLTGRTSRLIISVS